MSPKSASGKITVSIPFVDLKNQYLAIKEEIDTAILDVLSHSAFIGGPHAESFERSFADYCGVKHCVGVGNGTDALFIALKAFGIGTGDEVITAANSFIATSEAITMAGAGVVFVDIDPVTHNIDVAKIEEKITHKTKVIIPVHLYGHPAEMEPILEVARRHRLMVVEDAAQAHGAEYRGRRIGSLGHAASFSFYPGKNLGAYGDAGAIVTNDTEMAARARIFANHGRVDKYNHIVEGVNSRLDGLQAAIMNVKLKHLQEWTEQRRRNAALYNHHLKKLDLIVPREIEGSKAVYHLYVVRVRPEIRERLQKHLAARGIATGIHYPIALPNLKAYEYLGHRENDFPEATRASKEVLSLPIYPELEEGQIEFVAKNMEEFGL
jgi:dTDP-4-amino-4,6-dideoxygalactose transaminase